MQIRSEGMQYKQLNFQYVFEFDFSFAVVEFCRYLREKYGSRRLFFLNKGWHFNDGQIIEEIVSRYPDINIDNNAKQELAIFKKSQEKKIERINNSSAIKQLKKSTIDIKGLKGNPYEYQKIGIEFLINNNGYLAIKNTQNSFFQGNLVAVDKESGVSFPSFEDVAKTFKLAYFEMKDHSNVRAIIDQALEHPGPVLCEIRMSPNQPLLPKVYSEKLADGTMVSKPLEDMFPFLDREEFDQNML
ncbi:hypothetical protein A2392_00100 [Candidatus Kaiserbacteria bacterium RIFOXYB1_FULL_46_14]|uniref:Thiamine pyrophosphate enzyme TPP-binding domain-containing protein n=1 Tax=Candidatus Kaiserbacteria bacterium RIFOXYB1_FULL_46_14 TaxID=1798531 RepID=A0A1F6FHX8_9BACT|nr:MAG: hypothetical protein A2392_00100 [Candidatus Kaiserbacteria bacterium RIFOXYB1_FULL_46_14]